MTLDILIIDDEPDNAELISLLLELMPMAHHTRTHLAANGDEGLALAHTLKPDLILCDLSMPRKDGWSLLRDLRRSPDPAIARIPVAAITAHAIVGDRERVLRAGFNAYVSKPIDEAELAETVARLLNREPVTPEAQPDERRPIQGVTLT